MKKKLDMSNLYNKNYKQYHEVEKEKKIEDKYLDRMNSKKKRIDFHFLLVTLVFTALIVALYYFLSTKMIKNEEVISTLNQKSDSLYMFEENFKGHNTLLENPNSSK